MIIVAMVAQKIGLKIFINYMVNYGNLKQCENFLNNHPFHEVRFYPNNKSVRWDDVRFFDANWSEAMTIEELREYYEG
ncbi:hypothetical protein KNT87_gp057 [Erwinia phage Cronus]|uniref:Uncharacterized protein n=1 Tax=Erwinia phage Cronus TaxID=2163633 RepID=A0A2S1GM89_9CAUD|nr:hypothetical protein KNT87_gp057 [Erwinia phage Cronus]AWD90496.1 hypothetical protein [Erwinia phage Cronus]